MGSRQSLGQLGRVVGWIKSRKCSTGSGNTFTETVQGGEKYQQAFYVFEELAQAPSTSSIRSLVSQAVCELHLGRTEEAQAALEQALEKDANNADAIANLLVLNVISGNQSDEFAQSVPLSDSHL